MTTTSRRAARPSPRPSPKRALLALALTLTLTLALTLALTLTLTAALTLMLARALSRGPTDLQALNSELGREYRAHRDAHRGARAVSDHAVAAAAPQEGDDPITV